IASRRQRASSASSAARRFEIPHSRWCSTRQVSLFVTEAIAILLPVLHAPPTRVRDTYTTPMTIVPPPAGYAAVRARVRNDMVPDIVELGDVEMVRGYRAAPGPLRG